MSTPGEFTSTGYTALIKPLCQSAAVDQGATLSGDMAYHTRKLSGFNMARHSTKTLKRSKPTLLLEMIYGIPGMQWVKDCFQPPQHPTRMLPEPAMAKVSRTPHPQSHIAVEQLHGDCGDITLLLFQNSSNHLVVVTLGILSFLTETPIVDNQVASGTPLAIWWNNETSSASEVSVF
jgi:hypothetical protein